MAREFMEPFYFTKSEGTPLDGVGVGYCGGPTGATTPDEIDATNNNHHHNRQQSSRHPTTTTSSSSSATTSTTMANSPSSNNVNNNNTSSTDMMDAMKRKWVLFQANLDTMLQGIGFPQPFNRRRTGEGSGGGGGPGAGEAGGGRSGGDGIDRTATEATEEEKKRNQSDDGGTSSQSLSSRAHRHHHHHRRHHRTSRGEEAVETAGATSPRRSSSSSASDAVVVVQQEHIEMALLSQGELRLGVGHDFTLKQLSNPTWCDKCGDFIWGVYKQCLKCRPNKDNQHGPLLLKRHSPRDLSSFQHLSAVPPLRKTSAPHDMLMDFFKSDEHFQEFEREFANLGRDFNVFNRLRRDDDDCDGVRPSVATRGIEPSSSTPGSATPIPIRIDSPRGTELGPSSSGPSRTPIPIHVDYQPGGSCREPTPKTELTAGQTGDGVSIIHPPGNNAGNFFHADDTFLDFFNNDEDFKEFEREFANFKLKRRSRAFADDFNRRSNCDLFADLFPGFEGQSPRERRSRGSASDWDYLFNKIKRNSNIFTDPPRCLPAGESSDEDMPPVFASSHLNDSKTLSPLPPLPPPPYQEQSQQQQQWSSENPNRLSRKAVEIPIQRRPALPASPGRHFSPELCRRSVPKKNPLELKIEHVTSPCSSPTPSTRTPTGAQFVPKPRTDSPLLHINENEVDDSPGPSIRRVLTFLDDSDHDDDDDKADEPTTPTNTGQTVLHIDESCSDNDRDQGGIIIEHRFSEGFASPTTTITRRKKGSVAASSERSASPASPLALRHQLSRQLPSSELRDQQRRYTDPKVVIERRIPGRGSGPDMCKQNRSSTALEFLHDVQEPHRYYNRSNNNDNINNTGNKEQHPPHKDCQYTCHEKCRQLVTLDCKNSLPHSGSDGSIETSLSEPASTPGSNSTISDTSPNCNTDIVSNGEQRLPLGVDVRDQPRESPFQWITKSVREQQPYADLKDLMDWWEWENLQSLYFRHINSQHTLQFTAMLRPQDETDSGYRSGPIPEEILPKKQPSQETLNREDLQRKLQEYNNNVPFANLAMGSESRCSGNMDSGCSMTSNDLGQSGDMEQKSRVKPSSQVDSDPSTSPAHLAESDSDFQDGDGDDDDENNNKDGVFNNHHNESDGETFQGFIKVTLNLIRPITMSLGARPPSIYEVLTREHIVEQNTQSISFYMPRDTVKSIHVDSETTTKEVISALLKKFKILDNPRKFAMYEQELNNGKIVKLRRVLDDEFPLQTCLGWGTENLQAHRLVLQENEATGDIMWSNFSLPELNNFLKVLEREQDEHINQLQYKYRMMKKVILQRLKEIRKCRNDASPTSPSAPTTGSNGNHSPGGHAQKVI